MTLACREQRSIDLIRNTLSLTSAVIITALDYFSLLQTPAAKYRQWPI
jgi:hypothetical protein